MAHLHGHNWLQHTDCLFALLKTSRTQKHANQETCQEPCSPGRLSKNRTSNVAPGPKVRRLPGLEQRGPGLAGAATTGLRACGRRGFPVSVPHQGSTRVVDLRGNVERQVSARLNQRASEPASKRSGRTVESGERRRAESGEWSVQWRVETGEWRVECAV